MCITRVVLFRRTTGSEPSALLHVPIFSDTWSAHHSLSPGEAGGDETLGNAEGPTPRLTQPGLCSRPYPQPAASPMMARAVALPSWLRMASMTSSPLPSRLQRLMVWFPELIQ